MPFHESMPNELDPTTVAESRITVGAERFSGDGAAMTSRRRHAAVLMRYHISTTWVLRRRKEK